MVSPFDNYNAVDNTNNVATVKADDSKPEDSERAKLRDELADNLISKLNKDFFFARRFAILSSRADKGNQDASLELLDLILPEDYEEKVAKVVGVTPDKVQAFLTELLNTFGEKAKDSKAGKD